MEPDSLLADVASADFVTVPTAATVAEARSAAAGKQWIVLTDAAGLPVRVLSPASLTGLPPADPLAGLKAGAVLLLPEWLPVDQLARARSVRCSGQRLADVRAIVTYNDDPIRPAGVWAGRDFGAVRSVLSADRLFPFNSALPGRPDIPPVRHACAFAEAAAVCGCSQDFDELPDSLPECDNPKHLTAHAFTW